MTQVLNLPSKQLLPFIRALIRLFAVDGSCTIRAALLIQRWYRQYVARLEMRRRCTWNIFQSIEYAGEQDQIKLYNFFGFLMDHFTPASSERNLICHIFRKNEICRDIDWERYFCYRSIEVPDSYTGPHLTFPMTFCGVSKLVEAFKHKQNGLPSSDKPYVFNGDYVDRGKNSLEILLILFGFLLVYPNDVHLNRGNHEDHIVNLSWLPLATVIDQKVLIVHGGISDTTDLDTIGRVDRHKYVSALRPPKHHAVNGSTTQMMNRNGEANLPEESRRRVYSMNHCSSASAYKYNLQHRSFRSQSISSQLNCSVEEELKMRRRMAGFDQSYRKLSQSDSDSDPESGETTETDEHQWKQIVDMLWSDPMAQNGCVPNEVRGGGCYWGPDVTEEVLGRHNLQLLIRSHECKQEGYEFCHNRRVLTIFSASNYYEVGSNRGAYIRMGSDLVPHFIQYQASRTCRELTLRQRTQYGMVDYQQWIRELSITEPKLEVSDNSILETMYKNHSNLETIFRIIDTDHSGLISFEEFHQTWKLLSTHLKMEISDKAIADLAQSIDFNKDGSIDINEFMEAFRLVDLSAHS
ncbi:Serine/threonine-protein phosphatase with EF-hands 2 [Collichthys lucidus]|uniref:Serine/threonine-protein phosphatase n=1 Tax=Collichthys lucidus TaxID=240159 RepID=A0A4U5V8R2_COLLU|nr:Serine/threonine-protein phosphatase with EF-hands 2 [Collichthys lucidus]